MNNKNFRSHGYHLLNSLFKFILIASLSFMLSASQDQNILERPANKAAKVTIIKVSSEKEMATQMAPPGKIFLILETRWTNVHPKQKVEKSKLEKKQDRTMGVGALLKKQKQEEEEEYVEVDVAYVIPNFLDHAYLLADGEAYSLDKLTETIQGGIGLKKEFSLAKQGENKQVRLIYAIPESARNLAFQFFDYSYGHILIPIQGDLKVATGTGKIRPKVLGGIKDDFLELGTTDVDFQSEYGDEKAPEGWHYVIVKLRGKSLSAGGGEKNIVQIDPREYIWVSTKEGHFYYSSGGSITEEGYIRFTPDFYQNQEVAFLIPEQEKELGLGLRIQNRVYSLPLTASPAAWPPVKPVVTHRDGQTMEIMLFGVRSQEDHIILDLGIRSLSKSGLEIQTEAQFILKIKGKDIYFDEETTEALFHRPPTPFTIPPETFVRFEIAFETPIMPETLYYRGYESEKYFDLNKFLKK